MAWLIALGVVVVVLFFAVGIYNGLVRARQQSQNAWSQTPAGQVQPGYAAAPGPSTAPRRGPWG